MDTQTPNDEQTRQAELIRQAEQVRLELEALEQWVRDDILCGYGDTRTY